MEGRAIDSFLFTGDDILRSVKLRLGGVSRWNPTVRKR